MKIKLFEVREDEQAALSKLQQQKVAELAVSSSVLDKHTVKEAEGYEGVSVLGRSRLDSELLDALKARGVRYVSTRTIGYNHIDVAHAKRIGLRVCNASYPPYGVAEFTVMLMLLALRKYKPAMWRQGVNDYSLLGLQGRELRTLCVGVIGTGNIGSAVISLLQGFGCRIIAYDPFPRKELTGSITYVDLPTLYQTSDLITLHLPLTAETTHLIDRRAIEQMKDGVVLVNASRGELTDIEALTEGIETEKIGAIAMDVFEDEDGIYHHSRITDIIKNRKMAYLRQFPNVVLTQHIAFYTDINTNSMAECGVKGIIAMAEKGAYSSEL